MIKSLPRLFLLGTLITVSLGAGLVTAQSDSLVVTMTAEENIGFDCPVSAAIDPAGATLWVLMEDCGDANFWLQTFSVASGQPTNDEDAFAAALVGLEEGVADSVSTSLSFTPDGDLTIHYSDSDFQPASVSIAAGSENGTTSTDNASFIAEFTEYPDTTIYSTDGTQAIAIAENSLHILDLQSGTEILEFDIPGGNFNAYPGFSADGKQVYIVQINNPDDMSASASTLNIYSLPDGESVATYDLPGFLVWISPNGQYAVVQVTDDEMVVLELATNNYSQPLQMFEEPRPATTCLNNGRDVSGLDFTVTGILFLMDIAWLPDSSGFYAVNSYRGEGSESDNDVCLFNYSRLRQYTLSYE